MKSGASDVSLEEHPRPLAAYKRTNIIIKIQLSALFDNLTLTLYNYIPNRSPSLNANPKPKHCHQDALSKI